MEKTFDFQAIKDLRKASGLPITKLLFELAFSGSALSETAVRNWLNEENGSVPGLLHFLNLIVVLCDESDERRSAAELLLREFFVEAPDV